ncbi:MAG: hypothetical protein ACJA0W_003702 [Candidatus Azotimanducaceae bacterium]|jgi:hypothetical protein
MPVTMLFVSLFSIASCGGGGGGGGSSSTTPAPSAPVANSTPAAADDTLAVVVNTPTLLTITDNDSDSDGTLSTVTIVQNTTNGDLAVQGTNVIYAPNADYLGPDTFTYTVSDNDGAPSNAASVALTVGAITLTSLSVENLSAPSSGYVSQNNAELGTNVLTSPPIEFELPPNAISFSVSLIGGDILATGNNLFIAAIIRPDGQSLAPIVREITFCDPGFCSGLVPRATPIELPVGIWQIQLGTLAPNTNAIDFGDLLLTVASRTGPAPDSTSTTPAALNIRPHLTTTSINSDELDLVLQQLTTMAAQNGIRINFDPTVIVQGTQFAEVSRNFNDNTTSTLVRMGAADRVNLFFVENFSGAGGAGLLGISGGLPGPLGQQNAFNGILINATANRVQTDTVFARNTAEIAFHEMGHFLGLYHTTERQFDLNDVIDDTPNCPASNDQSNTGTTGVADIAECQDGQNPMFWNTDFSGNKTRLSEQQLEVIYRSPIARPGD